MSADALPVRELWSQTVDQVKDKVNNLSLWQALEKAVGIAIEDDTLIIGLSSNIFNLAGHLTVSAHRNAIESCAGAIAGRPLRMRVIEGDTYADWVSAKQRAEKAAASREAGYTRSAQQQAESQSWDALYDYVARTYSGLPLRQLPQSRARYVTDMLYVVADAMDQLYSADPDETTERMLARVVERIGTNGDMPSSVVALELERLRAWRAQNPA